MSISNYTALVIANNPNVGANVGGPSDNGKYVGWIEIKETKKSKYHPLLNTEPIYDTKADALKAMQKTIDEIKSNKDEHFQQISKNIVSKAIEAGIKDGSYKK